MVSDTGQLIGKGDDGGTEGILYHLSHLCRMDIGHHNLTLTKRSIELLYLLTYLTAIGTKGTIIV